MSDSNRNGSVQQQTERPAEQSSSLFLITSDGRTLSLPIASPSPRDPLNWSLRCRFMIFFSLAIMGGIAVTMLNAPSLLRTAMGREFGERRMEQFDAATALPDVMYGVGVIVWAPLCVGMGRRPVLVFNAVILLLGLILAWKATVVPMLMAGIALQGLAAGAIPTAGLLMAIDVTYIHQRPFSIALLWTVGRGTTFLVLACAPQVLDLERQWRAFYFIAMCWAIAALLLVYFLCPETYFFRPPVAFDGRILVQTGHERVRIYDDWSQVPGAGAHESRPLPPLPMALQPLELPPLPLMDMSPSRPPGTAEDKSKGLTTSTTVVRSYEPSLFSYPTVSTSASSRRAEKFRGRFRRIPGLPRVKRAQRASWRGAVAVPIQMVLCLVNPLVFWVIMHKTASFLGTIVIRQALPKVLHSAPYSMSPATAGYVDFAAALGCFLSMPLTYITTNRMVHRLTWRNKGVRRAAYYLPGFVLPVTAGFLANLLFGLSAAPPGSPDYVGTFHHWTVVSTAWMLTQVAFTGESIVSTLWVTEAFPQWAAGALAAISGLNFMFAVGINTAVPRWLESQGQLMMNLEIAVAILVAGGMGIPFAFWGKGVQQYLPGRHAAFMGGALRPQ
ncbi:hypothetical protein PpBr36_04182 [Pyricularia pennisetigena]|uniref:hypothetical protein n=1 Tax=Pyricularia pennisetigena TaxID=1578925 RepID=UPI0011510275|nr:hypothetical protein PpBr36_04182 [Pyricularia pennisetigena]TLS27414.1 hypothetical protein PpBr36_04182 [Pyricularia pennisetigena]